MKRFMRSRDWMASVALAYSLGLFVGVAGIRIANAKAQDSTNVNARYTVESIDFDGIDETRLSSSLRSELKRRIGEKFRPEVFAELAVKIKQELRARAVSPKLQRGTNAENIKVLLQVEPRRNPFDPSRSRVAFSDKQGWSGAGTVGAENSHNVVRAGYFSIGDDFLDRQQGITAAYQRKYFRDQVRLGFQFDTASSSWNRTFFPQSVSQYTSRQSYTPTVSYVPVEGLTLTAGMQFTNYDFAPSSQASGLGRGSSQSLISTLRFRRDWGEPDSFRQVVTAEYGTRIGTQVTGGDYSFRRHLAETRYAITYNHQRIETNFATGRLDGNAPLGERFVAGNARLLRGWNKYDITPVGATRITAGSVEYLTRVGQKWMPAVFVDSGAVWSNAIAKVTRNSVGAGIRSKDGFYLYIAVPLKEGRIEPQVMTGVNF